MLARVEPTLREAVASVLDAIKANLRDGGTRGRWESPLGVHVLPKLGARKLATITAHDIRDVLRPIWRTKAPKAEKAMQRLGLVFWRGQAMGLTCDPATVVAARHILGEVRHIVTHIPATPWQDAPALYARLGDGLSHLALRMMMLTLVRLDGVTGLRFDEVAGDVWTVPAVRMKGRVGKVEPFRVPLSSEAQRVLGLAQSVAEGPLAFGGPRGGAVTARALEKALDALGEAGRPHGFRTTFKTWVQDTEACSWDISETVLAHRIGGRVARSYARSDLLDLRRPVMAAWAGFLQLP